MELDDREELMLKFGTWPNYAVFSGMLVVSALIGIFIWMKGQSTPEEILLGGRSLSVLPVTSSIVATFISALTLLGIPAETYFQGTQYFTAWLFLPIISYLTSQLYFPVFHSLGITSTYQYLQLRFNNKLRVFVAAVYACAMIFRCAIVVYLPALALQQVTGVDVDISCPVIFAVCIFYTSIGGIKAVIWTDCFQLIFMVLSTTCIAFISTSKVGGASMVFDRNYQDGRIQLFNLALDPRERNTLWSTSFGGFMLFLSVYGVNQSQIQRYLTLPTLEEARRAIKLNFIGVFFLQALVTWTGMVMYAYYQTCDPLTAGQITKRDQILPLMVLQVAGDIPGFPGLFMAGVFSGSLSSVSSILNSLSAVTLKDFIPQHLSEKMTPFQQGLVTKVMSVVYGVLGFGTVFLIKILPGMLEAAITIGSVVNGPIIGLFTVGMMLPWVSSRGAMAAISSSFLLTSWLAAGGAIYKQYSTFRGQTDLPFPTNTSSCPAHWLNQTHEEDNPTLVDSYVLPGYIPVYDISYLWLGVIGFSVVCIVSIISILFTMQDFRKLDKKYLSPALPKLMQNVPKFGRDVWDDFWSQVGVDLEKDRSTNGMSLGQMKQYV